MKEIAFRVKGMKCSSCKSLVEETLAGLEGVASASVDLEAGTACVTYDPGRTDTAALFKAVRAEGFEPQSPR